MCLQFMLRRVITVVFSDDNENSGKHDEGQYPIQSIPAPHTVYFIRLLGLALCVFILLLILY